MDVTFAVHQYPKHSTENIFEKIRQTYSIQTLKPDVFTDFILNPCVGVTWVISSDESCFRIVVLPALSRPKITRFSLDGTKYSTIKIGMSHRIPISIAFWWTSKNETLISWTNLRVKFDNLLALLLWVTSTRTTNPFLKINIFNLFYGEQLKKHFFRMKSCTK